MRTLASTSTMMALALALGGCPKGASDADAGAGAGKAAVTTDAGAAAASSVASAADAAAASEAGATAGSASAWAGKYTISAGKMYVSEGKEFASVKFKNDESKMLGDGEMTLTVDASGRVSGSTDAGPLGASVIDGTSDGTVLTATIRRKDIADLGLTGTLVAKITGGALEGTMQLAEANAAVVRVGKLEAKKK